MEKKVKKHSKLLAIALDECTEQYLEQNCNIVENLGFILNVITSAYLSSMGFLLRQFSSYHKEAEKDVDKFLNNLQRWVESQLETIKKSKLN